MCKSWLVVEWLGIYLFSAAQRGMHSDVLVTMDIMVMN
jgi:hypothetical protein